MRDLGNQLAARRRAPGSEFRGPSIGSTLAVDKFHVDITGSTRPEHHAKGTQKLCFGLHRGMLARSIRFDS